MTRPEDMPLDPDLDLLLERTVEAPVERIWAAWTASEQLKRWFAPHPFLTSECEIDLRPGGMFRTVMRSPQGHQVETVCCYLDIVENSRLVWTTVLGPGFRPAARAPSRPMTAIISMQSHRSGTSYSLLALHGDPATRQRHVEQGFFEGWATTLDQLDSSVT